MNSTRTGSAKLDHWDEIIHPVAFITGGGQGIGRGIALELARSGADVVIAQRNTEPAQHVVREIEALERRAIALALDVTDPSSINAAVAEAVRRFPTLNVLVNNAGVSEAEPGKTSTKEFDDCYEVNVKGVWSITQAIVPHFKGRGGGNVVNIASVSGRCGNAMVPAYAASKAALINLTQSMAIAFGPDNINVNAICPGPIKTTMTDRSVRSLGNPHFYEEHARDHTVLKREVTVEDVGRAVVFLVSLGARNITGQSLNVDGGHWMN